LDAFSLEFSSVESFSILKHGSKPNFQAAVASAKYLAESIHLIKLDDYS